MRISRIRRALAACAIAAGFLGSAAFTQQASAELLEPDVVDPALATTCTISPITGIRTVTVGFQNTGFVAIHGAAVVNGCTPPGPGPGILTMSIVNSVTLATAPCVIVGPTAYPVGVDGHGAGEITGECPAGVANPLLYRIKAEVSWPNKTNPAVAYSAPV